MCTNTFGRFSHGTVPSRDGYPFSGVVDGIINLRDVCARVWQARFILKVDSTKTFDDFNRAPTPREAHEEVSPLHTHIYIFDDFSFYLKIHKENSSLVTCIFFTYVIEIKLHKNSLVPYATRVPTRARSNPIQNVVIIREFFSLVHLGFGVRGEKIQKCL